MLDHRDRCAFFLLLLLLLIPGCSGNGRDDSGSIPQMGFAVDPSLLGPCIADSALGFQLQPPAFLRPVDEAQARVLREEILSQQKPGDPFAIEPVRILRRPEGGGAFLIVSRFTSPSNARMTPEWRKRYCEATEASAGGATVKTDLFAHGNVIVLQHLISNPEMVLFRLVLQGARPGLVRVDLALPRSEYEPAVRAVESCLGSMAFF